MPIVRYEVLDYYPVSNEDDLVGESNRALLKWWLSYAPATPKKVDFDILDHLSLAPDIFLVERKSETAFEFKLHGETAHNIFDDHNGKIICTDGPSSTAQEREDIRLAHYYNEIVMNKLCIKNLGKLTLIDKSLKKFESLDCPLVDETKNVTHIIGTITALE
ncbi:hypothetical protein [Kiloniella sp.]|uniref:hypothetical protein n=1 Tax=Kiloniella sp. TaxID=1938587 RepID=UPI003B02937E